MILPMLLLATRKKVACSIIPEGILRERFAPVKVVKLFFLLSPRIISSSSFFLVLAMNCKKQTDQVFFFFFVLLFYRVSQQVWDELTLTGFTTRSAKVYLSKSLVRLHWRKQTYFVLLSREGTKIQMQYSQNTDQLPKAFLEGL